MRYRDVTLRPSLFVLLALHAIAGCDDPAPARGFASAPAEVGPSCAGGCRAASRCGFGTTSCFPDCGKDAAFAACLALATSDCNAAARCVFELHCRADAPRGTGTCADALRCQITECAAGDIACGCRCAASLAPDRALDLLRVDACATGCKFDNACMLRGCQVVGNACAMR